MSAQPNPSHQNLWSVTDNPYLDANSVGPELRRQKSRARGRERTAAWRDRRRERGEVHLRLVLSLATFESIERLQRKYGFRSLAEFIDRYLELVQGRIDVGTLAMPTKRSRADKCKEANVFLCPLRIGFLDRIKREHGLSRSYAVEALLAADGDPWHA